MSESDFVKQFYALREKNDPNALQTMIADDVIWREPDVGDHMGQLDGVDAVVDMITRALTTTGGTFSLRVAETIEINGHCAAIIEWCAEKGNKVVNGRELAIFSVRHGKISFAQFLPEDIANDAAFWVKQ